MAVTVASNRRADGSVITGYPNTDAFHAGKVDPHIRTAELAFAPGADLVVAGYLAPPVIDHCVRRERTDEALRVLCVSGGNEPLDDARQ